MNAVLKLHKVRVYKCKQCPRIYASSEQLDEHRQMHIHVLSAYVPLVRVQLEAQRYKCRTCSQDFQYQIECRMHELMHVKQERVAKKNALHGIVKPFECNECGVRYVLKSTLDAHSVVHKPFPHMCRCGIGYFRSTDFEAHRQTVHPNDRTCSPNIDKGPKTTSEFVVKRAKNRRPRRESLEENIDGPDEGMESPEDEAMSPEVSRTKFGLSPKSKAKFVKKDKPNRPKKYITERKLKNEFGEELDILRNKNGRFACPIRKCQKEFLHKVSVVRHYSIHIGEKPFECEQCHKKFRVLVVYEKHLSTHGLGKRKYICDYCDAGFYTKDQLESHIVKHMACKPYDCEICRKRLSTSASLLAHLRIHFGIKSFICQYCEKRFRDSRSLKFHEHKHTGVKPYQCSYCHRGFSCTISLNRHIRTHTGEKKYACYLCPRRFIDPSSLNMHNKRHLGVKTKACEICCKKFYCNRDVQQHLISVHTSIRKFECNECGRKFALKQNLCVHLRKMHRLHIFCDICRASFPSNKRLEKHKSKYCSKLGKKHNNLKDFALEI